MIDPPSVSMKIPSFFHSSRWRTNYRKGPFANFFKNQDKIERGDDRGKIFLSLSYDNDKVR